MKYCITCGGELNENDGVCPKCGAVVNNKPGTAGAEKQKSDVSFWAFLGMIILFSLPIIGLLSAFVFLFAAKKRTIKSFAGAFAVFKGAGLVIGTIITIIVSVAVVKLIGMGEDALSSLGENDAISAIFDAYGIDWDENFTGESGTMVIPADEDSVLPSSEE